VLDILIYRFCIQGSISKQGALLPGLSLQQFAHIHQRKRTQTLFCIFQNEKILGTKKFIVGAGSLATIVNVVEGVTQIWCAWDAAGGSI